MALLFVGALAFAAFHWGDVKKFAELLSKAKPLWLLGALLLQVGTYLTLALEWRLQSRAAFETALVAGLVATDFLRDGAYLLMPGEPLA